MTVRSDMMVEMEDPKPIRYWIDDQKDPLHSPQDVQDLFRRVEGIKRELLAEAIRKAALN